MNCNLGASLLTMQRSGLTSSQVQVICPQTIQTIQCIANTKQTKTKLITN